MRFSRTARSLACWSAALSAAWWVAGCSSNSTGSASDTSGDARAAAQADVYADALIGPNKTDPSLCVGITQQQTLEEIGSFPTGSVTPNKVTEGTDGASVTCTVTTSGNGFDVELHAQTASGALTITSPTGQGAISMTDGATGGITASLQGANGSFQSSNCSITLAFANGTVPYAPPAVAAGRIYGHLSCADAQDASMQAQYADGGIGPAVCDAEMDFVFENCAQ